ncbi:MAG: lysostaphin resistance A-like protein [Anaerobacillus sp.]|uniref:CPBP family intramembrane glutamic endopeptidase n=1 Tax=Anaerobacillus sp. TaxID=1872506 RepID=UPI00391CE116
MDLLRESIEENQRTVNLSVWKVLLLVFVPTSILTISYLIVGHILGETIPTLLIFFILALSILFPIQLYVVFSASKKEFGRYSLKSAFSNYQKLSWWKIITYAALLWAFAGVMSATIAPLEEMFFAPITERFSNILPTYFNWTNFDYLENYSRNILLLTCGVYFILNGFIGPIVEELFFRGYLTQKFSRFGNYAPFIITVLFSFYHFWLPFNNLFRIIAFYPAYYIAWKKKNIYIAIVFHCLCNLISAFGFILAVYAIL